MKAETLASTNILSFEYRVGIQRSLSKDFPTLEYKGGKQRF